MATLTLLALVVLFAAIVLYFGTLRAPSEVWGWYAGVDALLWCIFIYLILIK